MDQGLNRSSLLAEPHGWWLVHDYATVASSELRLARGDGRTVCSRCRVARSPAARARGLLGRKELASGEGLLIPRTRSIHTHFMRFPIDVVFLDKDDVVVRLVTALPPWRASSCRRARSVLELAAGEAERVGLQEGDRVVTSTGLRVAA
jgi:uncharacterized membrane protein (UPF0127 family)